MKSLLRAATAMVLGAGLLLVQVPEGAAQGHKGKGKGGGTHVAPQHRGGGNKAGKIAGGIAAGIAGAIILNEIAKSQRQRQPDYYYGGGGNGGGLSCRQLERRCEDGQDWACRRFDRNC
ncbi:MAG: hypothetical protein SFW09_16520 [Hyphomicrobiaceae bacterium]|nr:hypothetical protein [Hyphomicrobiaceae bacterium]